MQNQRAGAVLMRGSAPEGRKQVTGLRYLGEDLRSARARRATADDRDADRAVHGHADGRAAGLLRRREASHQRIRGRGQEGQHDAVLSIAELSLCSL